MGLQDFTPEDGRYDIIWIQWVAGHLKDGKSSPTHAILKMVAMTSYGYSGWLVTSKMVSLAPPMLYRVSSGAPPTLVQWVAGHLKDGKSSPTHSI